MWTLAEKPFTSRLLLGSALYPSPEVMADAIEASGSQIVTVALRRQMAGEKGGVQFLEIIKSLDVTVLPNTAGCRTAREAINTARMARELFQTDWIKLEVIGDDYTLQPDPLGLVEAARELVKEGFRVFPYTTEDLVLNHHLVEAGCNIIMPWASPIGSGQGLSNPKGLVMLRERLPDITLIVDAGIGKPSEAAHVMELGFDGVLINSAVALSQDPAGMSTAFAEAIEAGRKGYESGFMPKRDMASPSTPTLGTPFWHQA